MRSQRSCSSGVMHLLYGTATAGIEQLTPEYSVRSRAFQRVEDSLYPISLQPLALPGPQLLVPVQRAGGALRIAALPAEPREQEVRLGEVRIELERASDELLRLRGVVFGLELRELIIRRR